MSAATLYSFWASSCSWRVRAALVFKAIPFKEVPVDIFEAQEQLSEVYARVNPMQKVPALEIDGVCIVESMAILQYLEDTIPKPALQPMDPLAKARMREICEVIVSGIQPLQNIGLKSLLSSEAQFKEFGKYHIRKGLTALEIMLTKYKGSYCVGDQLSMADLCLVPQILNSVSRYEIDIAPYPTVEGLYKRLLQEDIFKATHPKNFKPASNSSFSWPAPSKL